MRFARSSFLLATALAVIALLAACATNPVTGERELMLITESQEIGWGQEMDQEIVNTYGLYPDDGLQAYVNSIGQPMAVASHRPHLKWYFRVLDTPVVNAFAVPGGYVYVTRGLMAHLNSEAELAMVIGHEIGHVTARHSAKAYSRQLLFMGGLLVGSLASEKFRKYAPIAAIGVQVLFLKFGRDQERQSDSLGVRYAYARGYQPREFDNFFLTLDRMKKESGGGIGLPNFLSTHPVTSERVKDVSAQADEVLSATPKGNLLVNRNGYLEKIDGLVFGDDPRQGYVKGNAFVHPDLGFQFRVPRNWDLDNTPTVVQMNPKSGSALLQLTLSKSRSTRDAFDQIASEMDMSVVDTEISTINGHEAFWGIGGVVDEETNYTVEVATVAHGSNIYAFLGLAKTNDFDKFRNAIESTMSSFDSYSENRNGARPTRLRIVRVPSDISVAQFFGNQGISDELRPRMMLINALRPGDTILAGNLIKVIQ